MKKFFSWLYLIVIVIFLYLPIGALMILSFNKSKAMSIWTGFTLDWYREMFSNEMILEAIWNTFSIAISASIFATIIGTLASIGLKSISKRNSNVLLGLNNVQLLNADIVVGISLMITFMAFGITLSWGTVFLSHVTFCLPYVILSVLPRVNGRTNYLYEAAIDLGASPIYAYRKVVIPEMMPGIIAGFLLSFTISIDDFVITHFTRGAGINTISTLIYSQVKVGIRPTLFALSTIIFVFVFIFLVIVNFMTGKKRKERV